MAPLIENDIELLPFLEFSDNINNISLLTQGLQRRGENEIFYSEISHFNSFLSFFTNSFSIFRSEQESNFCSRPEIMLVLLHLIAMGWLSKLDSSVAKRC